MLFEGKASVAYDDWEAPYASSYAIWEPWDLADW